jgi:hypothetical protein
MHLMKLDRRTGMSLSDVTQQGTQTMRQLRARFFERVCVTSVTQFPRHEGGKTCRTEIWFMNETC